MEGMDDPEVLPENKRKVALEGAALYTRYLSVKYHDALQLFVAPYQVGFCEHRTSSCWFRLNRAPFGFSRVQLDFLAKLSGCRELTNSDSSDTQLVCRQRVFCRRRWRKLSTSPAAWAPVVAQLIPSARTSEEPRWRALLQSQRHQMGWIPFPVFRTHWTMLLLLAWINRKRNAVTVAQSRLELSKLPTISRLAEYFFRQQRCKVLLQPQKLPGLTQAALLSQSSSAQKAFLSWSKTCIISGN